MQEFWKNCWDQMQEQPVSSNMFLVCLIQEKYTFSSIKRLCKISLDKYKSLFLYRLTVFPNMISFLILHQQETIQVHHISYNQVSMYLIINKSLQHLSCTFSRHWIFLLKPHIPEPYNIIVFTILLKSTSWHSIDKLCVLPLFKPKSETPRNYNLKFC